MNRYSLYFYINLIALITPVIFVINACVKDNDPPDCTKPANPTVPAQIDVNDGQTIKLSVTGANGGSFIWSGPKQFYSTETNPSINNANISNSGKYYVKELAGHCYSDSVAINVIVHTDSTCSLNDNTGDFPNGNLRFFSFNVNHYDLGNGFGIDSAVSADNNTKLFIRFKNKPGAGGEYAMTSNITPGSNEVYLGVIKSDPTTGNSTYYSPGNEAVVKVNNGKVNVVLCKIYFPNLGVFSANIVLK